MMFKNNNNKNNNAALLLAAALLTAAPASAARLGHSHQHQQHRQATEATTCTDFEGWHNSGGDVFDCEWYAKVDWACKEMGDQWYKGFTANEACCACGGGDKVEAEPNAEEEEEEENAFTQDAAVVTYKQCGVDVQQSSLALTKAVNDERVKQGKPALPTSIAMVAVAQAHIANLEDAGPYDMVTTDNGGSCHALHSWPVATLGDNVHACCYRGAGYNPWCMTEKPKEVTADWDQIEGCHQLTWGSKHLGTEVTYRNNNQGGDVTLGAAVQALTQEAVPANAGVIGCAQGKDYALCWYAEEDPNEPIDLDVDQQQ